MTYRMSELKKRILLALRRDEATSLKELDSLVGSYSSSISRSIQSLREEGLVDEENYVLTDKGVKVKKDLAGEYAEKLKRVAAPIGSYLNSYVAKIARDVLVSQRPTHHEMIAMTTAVQRISKSMQPLMQQMYAQRAIIEASLSHMIPQLQLYYSGVRELVEQTRTLKIPSVFSDQALQTIALVTKQYQQAYAGALESLRKLAKFMAFTKEEEFKEFDLNWLAFLPINVMKHIYELHKQGKDSEIWDFLKNIHKDGEYLEQLKEDFEKSKIFQRRMGIIEDTLQAHLEERYTLSVPVLLSQVEGILWDIGERKGIVSGKEIITRDGRTIEAHSAKQLLKQTMLSNFLFSNFVDFFTDKVYVENNRHAIMHGRSIVYPTEKNSVLAIMMLRLLLQYCEK